MAGSGGKPDPAAESVYISSEVDGDPMDDVLHKVEELKVLVAELQALDRPRVDIGNRLVDLEHFVRVAGYRELSQ